MKLKEYIEYYEHELDKLEKHRIELLEMDRNTRYTDDKIDFTYNLLIILRSSKRTEILREESNAYKQLLFMIEHRLSEIERSENKEEQILEFLEKLRKEVEVPESEDKQ